MFKLNTDGYLTSQGGGCGGIIRNDDGKVVAYFHQKSGHDNIIQIEAEAITIGIRIAKSIQVDRLWIEYDCLLVVYDIKGNSEAPWKIRKT